MKAIRIDSDSGKIEFVETTGKLDDIYAKLRCKTIEAVRPTILAGGDVMYVDEEGLLHDPNLFFRIRGWSDPIAGNGLILGTDEEGDEADCCTALETVQRSVEFLFS